MVYIQKHVTEPIIALSDRVPDKKFAKGLGDVLEKALSKRPEQRYQTAAEFADALRPFGGAAAASLPAVRVSKAPRPPDADNSGPPTLVDRPGPSPGLLVGVAAACLIAGVLLAVVVMRVMGR